MKSGFIEFICGCSNTIHPSKRGLLLKTFNKYFPLYYSTLIFPYFINQLSSKLLYIQIFILTGFIINILFKTTEKGEPPPSGFGSPYLILNIFSNKNYGYDCGAMSIYLITLKIPNNT